MDNRRRQKTIDDCGQENNGNVCTDVQIRRVASKTKSIAPIIVETTTTTTTTTTTKRIRIQRKDKDKNIDLTEINALLADDKNIAPSTISMTTEEKKSMAPKTHGDLRNSKQKSQTKHRQKGLESKDNSTGGKKTAKSLLSSTKVKNWVESDDDDGNATSDDDFNARHSSVWNKANGESKVNEFPNVSAVSAAENDECFDTNHANEFETENLNERKSGKGQSPSRKRSTGEVDNISTETNIKSKRMAETDVERASYMDDLIKEYMSVHMPRKEPIDPKPMVSMAILPVYKNLSAIFENSAELSEMNSTIEKLPTEIRNHMAAVSQKRSSGRVNASSSTPPPFKHALPSEPLDSPNNAPEPLIKTKAKKTSSHVRSVKPKPVKTANKVAVKEKTTKKERISTETVDTDSAEINSFKSKRNNLRSKASLVKPSKQNEIENQSSPKAVNLRLKRERKVVAAKSLPSPEYASNAIPFDVIEQDLEVPMESLRLTSNPMTQSTAAPITIYSPSKRNQYKANGDNQVVITQKAIGKALGKHQSKYYQKILKRLGPSRELKFDAKSKLVYYPDDSSNDSVDLETLKKNQGDVLKALQRKRQSMLVAEVQ